MNSSSSRDSLSVRRPTSSASTRPPSSASASRPPSSASVQRSSSALSVRPSTNASVTPSTSASAVRPTRPSPRVTTRPSSRMSNRPSTKQLLRLLPLFQDLVIQLTSLTPENNEDKFRVSTDFVSKNLDPTVKPAMSTDMDTIGKQIGGHVQKSRIMSEDTFADALAHAFQRLKMQLLESSNELDAAINMTFQVSRMPSHLQLLLLLSSPPRQTSLEYAEEYMELVRNPLKVAPGLTWMDILAEEPFEGQHWEGVFGLPPGSTLEHWESESGGSTPSLSALDDVDDIDDTISSVGSIRETLESQPSPLVPPPEPVRETTTTPQTNYSHRDIVEALQARQYWREDWKIDVSVERPLNVKDISTFGPAFKRALGERLGVTFDIIAQERYIYEHDAVREILMGLQGRRNLMISWTDVGDEPAVFTPAPDAPGVLHLTASALNSVLLSFARTATVVEHLRKFVRAIYNTSLHGRTQHTPSFRLVRNQYRNTRTVEAFAEAVDAPLHRFDSWCATREEQICKAQGGVGPALIVSFLSLEVAIRDEFSDTFVVIRDLLLQLTKHATRSPDVVNEFWTLPELPRRMSPSSITSLLLDSLLLKVIEHASIGDTITSRNLMSVFSDTAEPLWSMIGKWVGDGMPVHDLTGPSDGHTPTVDDEFFVEDNELPLLDPDFWSDGFVLRDGHDDDGDISVAVPIFLQYAAEHVLYAGKAVGLLRALGMATGFERAGGTILSSNWPPFRSFLPADATAISADGSGSLTVGMSMDYFSRLVYDELVVPCKAAQVRLTQVLVDDCDLWQHLSAMEDLLLMRRGDAISNLVDILFSRMDSPQPWTDFHFLNSAFRDVVELGRSSWIDPSLVRFSHRGKDKNIGRTVRAIEGLLIEYAIPFPLTYIFGPRTMQIYSSIFVFALQIRRAKNALERILVRSAVGSMPHAGNGLKVFYAMRSKLSWFVNGLLNFVSTNVLHTQIASFHVAFRSARSLDEMIALHNKHLDKLEGRCLLQPNTSALHRAVTSILDMCLHFSDCFVAFAGDTTHDISRQSLIHMRHHRSKRQKRQRRNVIGFSQSLHVLDLSSSSESEQDEESVEVPETSFPPNATSTIDLAEESFYERLDKMSGELDALVRFIRRGVESIAGGTGEAAPAFGIFAFALEDWDR